MAVVTQIPTPSEPLTRDKGLVTTPWFQFFMHVFNTVSPGGGPAPANGGYVVTSADPSLPNARVATSSATVTVNTTTPGVMRWDALGSAVVVDPAGALEGDGSVGDPLAVRVDGATIVINGSNQLEATTGGSGDVVGPASAVDDRIATFDGVTGKLIQDGGQTIAQVIAAASSSAVRVVACHINDGGTVIATGVKGFVRVPYSGTITKVTVLSVDAASTAGSIVVDVWKDTLANYPPDNADSITASAPPTLSSANKSEDATLTGWSTSVTAGDVFGFNVDSATTVTSVLVELEVTT